MQQFKVFDVPLRTSYFQAKELAMAQQQVPLTTPGSLQIEQRGDGHFVYRYRYEISGRRTTEYLGREDDEATVAKVAAANDEIRDAHLLADCSRDLRRVGYYSVGNSTLVTLASIFNAGIFEGGGVLVGTHAFGAILNELGVRCAPLPLTEDIDLARAGRIEIAALPSGGFLTLLRSSGLQFHEVPQLRRRDPATSFKVRGKKLKVDLLVPATGKPYEPVAVPEPGVPRPDCPTSVSFSRALCARC